MKSLISIIFLLFCQVCRGEPPCRQALGFPRLRREASAERRAGIYDAQNGFNESNPYILCSNVRTFKCSHIRTYFVLNSSFTIHDSHSTQELEVKVDSLLAKGETLQDTIAVEEVASEIASLGRETLPILIENLGLYNNPRLEIARKAVVKLGHAIVEELLEALPGRYWIVQRGIGSVFPLLGEDILPTLAHSLKTNPDPLVRRYCAQALGEMKSASSGKPLIEALKDKDWSVRSQSAFSLGDLKDPEAIEPLVNSIQKDRDDDVRRNCAIALKKIAEDIQEKIGTTRLHEINTENKNREIMWLKMGGAVKPLIRALYHPHHRVRFPAADCLIKIGELCVEPLLQELARSKDFEARFLIITILGEIGDVRGIPVLIELLKDKDWGIRGASAQALGRLKDPRIFEAMNLFLQAESHPFVREKIERSLLELNRREKTPPR